MPLATNPNRLVTVVFTVSDLDRAMRLFTVGRTEAGRRLGRQIVEGDWGSDSEETRNRARALLAMDD